MQLSIRSNNDIKKNLLKKKILNPKKNGSIQLNN